MPLRTLIIAEKPSVARDIAKVLNCTEKGANFIEGKNYVITWALGHLVKLQDPDKIDEKYKRWRIEDLPILPHKIPLQTISTNAKQYRVVKDWMLSKEISDIICATDAGREGELIFRFIYEHTKCKKPFRRLWISSMTDESIAEGFRNIKEGSLYDNLFYSSICRVYADWYIGMNASRLFSVKYNANLSIGRVQTPTLALIVKRQLEINAFVPVEYYTLLANFGDFQAYWFDKNNPNIKVYKQIESKEKAEEILASCKTKFAEVISNDSVRQQELAPQLYDLTSLQRDANEKLGFTADKTLKIAQNLYEKHKVLTYPRTDSRYLSEDMKAKIPSIINSLLSDFSDYSNFAQNHLKSFFTKRYFNNEKVSDHHAIILTGKRINWGSLSEEEVNLLKLVVARFFAGFYPAYLTDLQKIILKIEIHHFIAQGKTLVDLGWKIVENILPSKKKLKKEEELKLPQVNIGEKYKCINGKIKQDKTKAPEQYTDSTLLSAMENAGKLLEDEELKNAMKANGLGTPATRAAIIERLIKVAYIKRNRKHFEPTDKGLKLIELVPDSLSSPELTGNWEYKLNQIASGKDKGKEYSIDFLNGIRHFTTELIQQGTDIKKSVEFSHETRGKKKSLESLGTCLLCKEGEVLENSRGYYCSRWRQQCKFTVWKDSLQKQGGPILTADLMKLLLTQQSVKGSTGKISLKDSQVSFQSKF